MVCCWDWCYAWRRKPKRDPKRQLRIVVGGLMGSGKSTLCRTLSTLLGGHWVNQDEFALKGKGAKKAFLKDIEMHAQSKEVPVLIVDKINTTKQHRTDILDAMSNGIEGDAIFVQIEHPLDAPDSLQHMMALSLERIRTRGHGHRTLMGDDPKLESILKMTAQGREPLDVSERNRFAACVSVDVTLKPVEIAMKLLRDMDKDGFLGRFIVDDLVTTHRIEEAFATARQAELNTEPAKKGQVKKGKKTPRVWYWSVVLDSASEQALQDLWRQHEADAPGLSLKSEFHTTLIFLGKSSHAEIAARLSHLGGEEVVAKILSAIQAAEGTVIELPVEFMAWDSRIAAIKVIDETGLCTNMFPHVTVALSEGVSAVMSNDLLARNAASADFSGNLGVWLTSIGLHSREERIRDWITESGVTSRDDLAARAAEVAAAIEVDESQRTEIETTLAKSILGGPIRTVQMEPRLVLRGKVQSA